MDIGEIFIQILTVVSDSITSLLAILPNPDPFPDILNNIELSSSDFICITYYWIDQFFYADAIVSALGTWFVMFPLAWLIIMLLKWAKAR